MVNRSAVSVNKNRLFKKSAGLSMLEVILVLGFMGIVLATLASYVKKRIDEKRRELVTTAIAQDVSGLLKFINSDTLDVKFTEKGGRETELNIINPLFQQQGQPAFLNQPPAAKNQDYLQINPLTQIHGNTKTDKPASWSEPLLPYAARVWAKAGAYNQPIANAANPDPANRAIYSQPMKWSEQLWNKDKEASLRKFFTDSSCATASGSATKLYFTKEQFLSCHESPTLKNSELSLARVDLVSSRGSRLTSQPRQSTGIDRLDIYIRFKPDDGNSARLAQYTKDLTDAFKDKDIAANNNEIYLVKQQGNDPLKWELLELTFNDYNPANSPTPVKRAAKLSDLPRDEVIGEFTKGGIFGLRFTFDGKGDFLRTDGSNAATKVCWNSKTGKAAPCIQAEDQADNLLTLKKRNSTDFGDLQLASVVLEANHIDPATKKVIVDERYTAPRILYRSFSNKNLQPTYNDPANKGRVCLANGVTCNQPPPTIAQLAARGNGGIRLPIQSCPAAVNKEGKKIILHPRLSAAVSSASSTLLKDGNGAVTYNVPAKAGIKPIENLFSLPGNTLENLSDQSEQNGISINRLGGVVLQIIKQDSKDGDGSGWWHIVSVMSIEDTNANTGHTWQYYNPPWLSVMITSWCSVDSQEKQPWSY